MKALAGLSAAAPLVALLAAALNATLGDPLISLAAALALTAPAVATLATVGGVRARRA